MVLEGLKRADTFISLLRGIGFQRSDGRPLKPEHLDQDFECRQISPALSELVMGLQARILSKDELAQYPPLEDILTL